MAEAVNITKPGCKDKCGNVMIPYPFGIGRRCSLYISTEMRCDTTFNPPKLFFKNSIPYQVVNLSVQSTIYSDSHLTARIKHNISRICYDSSGAITSNYPSVLSVYNNTPFTLSRSQRNRLTVIGCNMRGLVNGALRSEDSEGFTDGCTTHCDKIANLGERRCPGPGCCQVSVNYYGRGPYNITVEALDVSGITDTRWESYMPRCKGKHSSCADAYGYGYGFGGYDCICHYGYVGNPYLDSGCQKFVGECNDFEKKTCNYKWIKYPGDYYECASKPFRLRELKWIILGAGLGLCLLVGGVWMYLKKREQLLKVSEKLKQLNARLLLIQEISSNAKIFTAKKLQQATNNFHKSRILGEGGYGTVYKGILPDQSIVAVKKSKIIEKSQFDEFINEVAILAKIDHRNIVKLLGCSVETEHPLLVYEFVSNGTLADHLFKKSTMPYSSMSWENRLRIAAEVAGALAYLHSAASIPIIHRDVKSSNILLDENFTAKVADFGVSRLNHLEQTVISTLVKGTLGYLDPEY